jgi:hypothetical protein
MNEKIQKENILGLFKTIKIIPETNKNFPKGKDFNKLIKIGNELLKKNLSLKKISEILNLREDYTEEYANSLVYLDLIDPYHEFIMGNKTTYYRLSEKGLVIFPLPGNSKLLFLTKTILEHQIFNTFFKTYLETNNLLSNQEIIELLKDKNFYDLKSDEDYNNASLIVNSWIKWIIDLYQ